MKHPVFANERTEKSVGIGLVVVGFFLLYDAYDGRGKQKPRVFGPFLPW